MALSMRDNLSGIFAVGTVQVLVAIFSLATALFSLCTDPAGGDGGCCEGDVR